MTAKVLLGKWAARGSYPEVLAKVVRGAADMDALVRHQKERVNLSDGLAHPPLP